MCHRDKSVNRSEARKFFQITSKEVESGPPTTTLFRSHPFVCVCELIESAGTHASENARALVCVWCFHILPSDRSANKLLGLPVSMFHILVPYHIPHHAEKLSPFSSPLAHPSTTQSPLKNNTDSYFYYISPGIVTTHFVLCT